MVMCSCNLASDEYGCCCCVVRLAKFSDEWPMMEKWFEQFSILKQVDASAGLDDVIDSVENIIQQTLDKNKSPQVHTEIYIQTHADRQTDRQTDRDIYEHTYLQHVYSVSVLKCLR